MDLMEHSLSPLAATHLLQHTLRSLCLHENSHWAYAVFWRILPRNFPPPKWEGQGAYDRSRGNRRNWILVWEDGFCNFAASSVPEINSSDCPAGGFSVYGNYEFHHYQGLQPEIFFKMSHEIYNYGEGLMGKVAADHSHKWIYNEHNDQESNLLSAWQNTADTHPRTWQAQFQSGIKTIALIAVREGVVQLGALHKVIEELSTVVLLRKMFNYIESIPGVLLPHPSSSAHPYHNNKVEEYGGGAEQWHCQGGGSRATTPDQFHNHQPLKITPTMSSLEALLSKLPTVEPPPPALPQSHLLSTQRAFGLMGMQKVAKEEVDDHQMVDRPQVHVVGESSSSMMPCYGYQHHFFQHQL